jgi:hypothetical protein
LTCFAIIVDIKAILILNSEVNRVL